MSAATYTGINEIIDGYINKADKPFFSMWVDNLLVEQNIVNDFEISKNKIITQIEDFARSGMTKIIYLKIHSVLPDKKSGTYTKTDPALTMYCQAKAEMKQISGFSNDNIYPIYQLIEKQNETINALVSKINAIEGEEEEENENIGSYEEQLLEKISGIVNSPLGLIAANFLSKYVTPQQTQKVAGISGIIDENSDLENTIKILFNKGVTIEHLKKLSEMPESKIKMLLTML